MFPGRSDQEGNKPHATRRRAISSSSWAGAVAAFLSTGRRGQEPNLRRAGLSRCVCFRLQVPLFLWLCLIVASSDLHRLEHSDGTWLNSK